MNAALTVNTRESNKKISTITPPKDLAVRIKIAITAKSTSQEKLAARMGMSTDTLNQKINGKRKFTVEEAFLLAEVLQVPFEQLFYKHPY